MNTLIVIESLTIVNLLNKVQFPFPPQMLSSSSEGTIVQAVPIAFAPVGLGKLVEWVEEISNMANMAKLLLGTFNHFGTLFFCRNGSDPCPHFPNF